MANINWANIFDEDQAQGPARPASKGIDWANIFDEGPVDRNEGFIDDLGTSLKSGFAGIPKSFGDLFGVVTGDMDNVASTYGAEKQAEFQKEKSPELVALEEQRRAAVEASDGEFAKGATAFWETVSSPTLFANFVVEQAPLLLPIGAVGRGAKFLTGLIGYGKKVAQRVGSGAAIGTGTAMQTGDVAGSAYEELLKVPQEIWDANPDYQSLRKTLGDEEAKKQIALEKVRGVAPLIAGASLVSQAVPGGTTIERVLGGGTLKKGVGSRAGRALTGALGEASQEAIEEGSGQLLSNVAVSGVDPDKRLTEGVGEAAGLGALGGGVFGGLTGAFDVDDSESAFNKLRSETDKVRRTKSVDEALAAANRVAGTLDEATGQFGFDFGAMPEVTLTQQEELDLGAPTVPSQGQEQMGLDLRPDPQERLPFDADPGTLTGAALDQALVEELRRAEGLDAPTGEKRNLAATKLDKPKNTQVADQLVQAGVAQPATRTQVYGDEIRPKSGAYSSREAAEQALRAKRQTPREDRLADLENFEPVETPDGTWVLGRKAKPTEQADLPQAPATDTLTRAQVNQALKDAGVAEPGRRNEVFQALTPVEPNVYKAADVQAELNRYQLKPAEGPAVTDTGVLESVQKAFPTGRVEQLESGAVRVDLPNGSQVRVMPDQTIEVSRPAAERGYGKDYKGEKTATGAFARIDRDGLIWLDKSADQGTVNHEAFHMAWETVLTEREKKALTKKFGSEEGAAQAYGEWSTKERNGIFEKIKRFFRRVRESLFGATAEGSMERVQSGEVFERESNIDNNPEPPRGTSPGKPLKDVRVEFKDDSGRRATMRADQALDAADERITTLEQLRECLAR